ncbi:MAG: ethylbenzene dehydrogenase [Anaerolinea sp.]|nr:ethylbenzene dehydrogenase [Anaerolinea sp.]
MTAKRLCLLFPVILVIALILSAAYHAEPTIVARALATEMSLVSVPADSDPTLDGVANEDFWKDAPSLQVELNRGANHENPTVTLKSVYTSEQVYFLVTWDDPTQSYLRTPWEMQPDGTWKRLGDPKDKGGDNNLWYEDKLAMIWDINNSIKGFEEDGCFVACHRSKEGDPDAKPYGNKFLENEGERGDMWHWKGVRNLAQIHDQYLDNTPYSKETVNAGRKSDPDNSKGYRDNLTEDKKMPAFMPAGEFTKDGAPGFLLEDSIVPFDPAGFKPGDRLPSIIITKFTDDGGNISAGWKWVEGKWTLEFGRKLVTGSEFDVQFSDLSATYYFGIAAFDNAQVRHSFHKGSIKFTFKQ